MHNRFDRAALFDAAPEETPSLAIERLLAMARRQWRLMAVCGFLAACLGAAYALTAIPLYTASATILIDTGNKKIVDEMSAAAGVGGDDASILSQVEILKSDKLARSVSASLSLKDDAMFMAQRSGPVQNVMRAIRSMLSVSSWLKSDKTLKATPEQVQQAIVDTLEGGVRISRVGVTYVLSLSYSSPDPDLAARIARAYAEAYLQDQLDSKVEATKLTGNWLQKRIGELRQNALDSDRKVQRFRAEHGLISTDGQLISEQQLTQINTQLVKAAAETAGAKAKYDRIEKIINDGDMDAAFDESLSSNVVNDLRSKYLDASRKEADISSRLGPNHTQAIRLRGQMTEFKRLMFEELGRIAQSYQNNYEIALAQQNSLREQVAKATGVSATANDAQVQLRELEREADTYKKLYETFLQHYQEAIQQQSFPVTEARIITYPSIPSFPSSPKTTLIVAFAMFLGLLAGAGIGAFREYRDRFFRTADQIRDTLQLEPIGTIPAVAKKGPVAPRRAMPAEQRARLIDKTDTIASYINNHPLSSFAETLRSAKIAVDIFTGQKRPKLVGIVSIIPGEGKSTISINFAEQLAGQGARVLLVDADLRNPGATRQIGRHAERGIVEALEGGEPIKDLLMMNPDTGLAFLPAVIKRSTPYSAALLSSAVMDHLIHEASNAFDYIVFDLPPLGPVVDARAMAAKIDTYLLVVEWGKTSRTMVKKTLLANAVVAEKCAGVILNKVNMRKMKTYQSFGSPEFYYSQYRSYYEE